MQDWLIMATLLYHLACINKEMYATTKNFTCGEYSKEILWCVSYVWNIEVMVLGIFCFFFLTI